jgi:hypothetical protein
MKSSTAVSLTLFAWLLPALALAETREYRNQLPPGKYAVVVSKATNVDPEWKKVVEALVQKHHAEVIEYEGKVDGALDPLKKSYPRYACFVARPEEAGREFVVAVSRLTRKLDGGSPDPYTDVIWGIVTGYSAADALRIASIEEPLAVRRAAAGTAIDLNLFDEGIWYNEGSDDEHTEKKAGVGAEKKTGPADAAKELADIFNDFKPDLFLTSGHATFRDWQIGYPPHDRRGQFRCQDGVMYGVDTQNRRYPIQSPNPKIYLAAGNCLMGRIVDKQSMALAWLGSAGVDQMIGYTVSTWYGRAGWGTRDYLFADPGRYTLAEAFYFNQQTILHELNTRFRRVEDVDFDEYDIETNPALMGKLAAKLAEEEYDREECFGQSDPAQNRGEDTKDDLGLHWDRDTLAFYGDPAWEARLAPRDLPFDQVLFIDGDKYTFEIRAKQDCTPSKPPAMFFPYRNRGVSVLSGKEFEPLVTDNFIMLMKPGEFKAGQTYRVTFEARRDWSEELEHGYHTDSTEPLVALLDAWHKASKPVPADVLQKKLPFERDVYEIYDQLFTADPSNYDRSEFIIIQDKVHVTIVDSDLQAEFVVENSERHHKRVNKLKEIATSDFTINDFRPHLEIVGKKTLYLQDEYLAPLVGFLTQNPNPRELLPSRYQGEPNGSKERRKRGDYLTTTLRIGSLGWGRGWEIETPPTIRRIYFRSNGKRAIVLYDVYSHFGEALLEKGEDGVWEILSMKIYAIT